MVLALTLPAHHASADEVEDLIALVASKPDGMDRDEWREKRRDAARRLGQLGDRRAVPALIQVVKSEAFDVVGEIAIEALGKIGDARAAPVLQMVIDDPSRDRYVRSAAKKALARTGGSTTSSATDATDSSDTVAADPSDPVGDSSTGSVPIQSFDEDAIAASERLTLALGNARFAYDTVSDSPQLNGSAQLEYLRSRDYQGHSYQVTATGAVSALVQNGPGAQQSARALIGSSQATGAYRLYHDGGPLHVVGAARLAAALTSIDIELGGGTAPIDDNRFGADVEGGLGVGWGRVLNVGERLRVARIESALRRARALGRPITDDLAQKLMAAWWKLRDEVGVHTRLTRTVSILRESGVLLGEPSASLSYQLGEILRDGQLQHRFSGLRVELLVAESYLVRDSALGALDGRAETVLAHGRFARQLAGGKRELDIEGLARYRILAPDGEPAPWALTALGVWRNYMYGRHQDPLGALEIGGELGASDYDLGGDRALRVAGRAGWLWTLSRASRFRLAGEVRYETGELFVGALFEAAYGLLDAGWVSRSASP